MNRFLSISEETITVYLNDHHPNNNDNTVGLLEYSAKVIKPLPLTDLLLQQTKAGIAQYL